MSELYLAYGSNINRQQMAVRCPTAVVKGTSVLQGYELQFRGSARAVATVCPKENSFVPVLIWNLQPADELALDRYEGYPRSYDKELVEVLLEDVPVIAMMYVMVPGRALGAPSTGYFNIIAEGYRAAGFDLSILLKAALNSQQTGEEISKRQRLKKPKNHTDSGKN
jgi:hypothetical protein